MEPKIEQFNRFDGGITSELRTNFEIPKFARLWNFDVTSDRAIQVGGWDRITTEPTTIFQLNARSEESSGNAGNFAQLPDGQSSSAGNSINNFVYVDSDGNGFQTPIQCSLIESAFDMHPVDLGTVPIVYNKSVVYRGSDGKIYMKRFYVSTLGSLSLDPLGDEIFVGVTTYTNTFFVEGADNKLYMFTGRKVYALDSASVNANNTPAYTPVFGPSISEGNLTQFMKEGDVNGNQGTYTILGVPVPYIITQVAILQDRLRLLGFDPGPSDGSYGPNTEAAVTAFQNEFRATGTVVQPIGANLIPDGIVGPETLAALNLPQRGNGLIYEYGLILDVPYPITAVHSTGGYIVFATKDENDNAKLYYWDLTIDPATNRGDIGLITFVNVGMGLVQWINEIDGKTIVCMSPFTSDRCSTCYNELVFYEVQTYFERYPASYVSLLAKLKLKNNDGGEDSSHVVYRKTIRKGSKIYFMARLMLESNIGELEDDPGAFSGVMSIDSRGIINTEAVRENLITDNGGTASFGLTSNGFIISTNEGTFISDTSRDNNSGVITKIINGGQPWRNKQLENIFVALDNTDDLDSVELYVRDLGDKNDNDGGWIKVYDGGTSDERRNFNNRIHLNRNTESMERFTQFRELQVMLIIDGRCVELIDLTVVYNMLDLNK